MGVAELRAWVSGATIACKIMTPSVVPITVNRISCTEMGGGNGVANM